MARDGLHYSAHNLDVEAACAKAMRHIASSDSKNFATYFNDRIASATTDLTPQGLSHWTQNHSGERGVKWIHFWTDASQQSLIEDIASHYDVSPRLIALLCPQTHGSAVPDHARSAPNLSHSDFSSPKGPQVMHDVESLPSQPDSDYVMLRETKAEPRGITFGDIVEDLWHFHSVDWGEKYIHVGVNVLSVIPGVEYSDAKPAGQRLWTSLILCHDGTVISTLQRHPVLNDPNSARLANKISKRHILSVLQSISRVTSKGTNETSNLLGIKIRPDPKTSQTSADTARKEYVESAGLLFYYLFDDWMSTYSLIARREHPYREKLQKLRQDLITSPDVQMIEHLHNIGQQLVVLRSMYQSYATVVTRILARHQKTMPVSIADNPREIPDDQYISSFGAEIESSHSQPFMDRSSRQQPSSEHQFKRSAVTSHSNHPTISPAALFRFERLLDRIHLYALSEINQALAEKESLSLMTFNLLTLSESHSIEKLTRTTILLAKATVLFLPVSLLTSYFSINFKDIANGYVLQTYWLSFLVVAVVSIVFLVGFEFAMTVVQGGSGVLSLHQALWRKVRAKRMIEKQARQ